MTRASGVGGLLLVLLAVALVVGAPWWIVGLLVPPALMWAPGSTWAPRLCPEGRLLDRVVDAVWLSATVLWLTVAVARELGLRDWHITVALWGLPAGVWLAGAIRGRSPAPTRAHRGAAIGVLAVIMGVLSIGYVRADDVARPLHGHWYLEGAPEHGQTVKLPIRAGRGVDGTEAIGWEEAGAARWTVADERVEIVADDVAEGTLVLAVQGPIGTRISTTDARGNIIENTVERDMMEASAEFAEARYLDHGVAGIAVEIELTPGDVLPVAISSPDRESASQLYVMPSSDAIWSLHATGALRFTHRWQILNQVENQRWANEMLTTRRFTWNQPPGWSPLLTTAVWLTGHDLDAAGLLFLWVIAFVGLCGVRAGLALAPGAPAVAWVVPGGLAASHGLLMLEPASHNFPDSLYAAAVVSLLPAIASGSPWRFGLAGVLTQALRWPGTVLALIVAGSWRLFTQASVLRAVGTLAGMVAFGGVVAGIAVLTGDANDLGFILYFETFPEHWHDDYAPTTLLSRVPHFYALWTAYCGGAVLLAIFAAIGPRSTPRSHLRVVLAVALTYSALLCTVDHHPTHYFLPLVALMGPATIAASACYGDKLRSHGLVLFQLTGVLAYLSTNRVW